MLPLSNELSPTRLSINSTYIEELNSLRPGQRSTACYRCRESTEENIVCAGLCDSSQTSHKSRIIRRSYNVCTTYTHAHTYYCNRVRAMRTLAKSIIFRDYRLLLPSILDRSKILEEMLRNEWFYCYLLSQKRESFVNESWINPLTANTLTSTHIFFRDRSF